MGVCNSVHPKPGRVGSFDEIAMGCGGVDSIAMYEPSVHGSKPNETNSMDIGP